MTTKGDSDPIVPLITREIKKHQLNTTVLHVRSPKKDMTLLISCNNNEMFGESVV